MDTTFKHDMRSVPDNRPVSAIMTRNPVYVELGHTAVEAAVLMKQHNIGVLPVWDPTVRWQISEVAAKFLTCSFFPRCDRGVELSLIVIWCWTFLHMSSISAASLFRRLCSQLPEFLHDSAMQTTWLLKQNVWCANTYVFLMEVISSSADRVRRVFVVFSFSIDTIRTSCLACFLWTISQDMSRWTRLARCSRRWAQLLHIWAINKELLSRSERLRKKIRSHESLRNFFAK